MYIHFSCGAQTLSGNDDDDCVCKFSASIQQYDICKANALARGTPLPRTRRCSICVLRGCFIVETHKHKHIQTHTPSTSALCCLRPGELRTTSHRSASSRACARVPLRLNTKKAEVFYSIYYIPHIFHKPIRCPRFMPSPQPPPPHAVILSLE